MNKDIIKSDTKPMSLLSLILSFMALFVISGLLFFPLRPETRQVLIGLDFLICSIFMLQLSVDLIRSTNKLQFMKRHWIDFLASLPMIEPLRYARLFSILRVVLVIRSSRNVIRQLLRNKHETTLASILLLMVILLTAGSSMMLFIEGHSPSANIKDGGDAMWWALVTISTVGYGDHYPVTDGGRILAAGLIICGVGLFGMISGLVTSMITSPSKVQTTRSENKEKLLIELVEKQNEILRRLDNLEQQNKREP
ncbi:potassium channel family protein [Vibrio sp. MarTm2]|uniref:Capsular biosynthesis protein n=3 Tax=Vibrio TaxID=662 RepID=A0A0A5HWQ3_PHOS4|nr:MULTISPECIES: potassium channel family protein [Vibrio]KGY08725.1 capsular biosynthesis protein [Vibrio sinaloensis]KHA58758.1 capsular biosynthesis protein [Vibrio variabilis]KHD23536.1 capsular biosynthesis protein [Vibrio caribbeanicus]KHT38155.1 capsular biosynthesis protein [Vibrio sinaloensis]KHT43908.1 capsular biosynthesis protein [Vibrio sinaloensis]